MGVAVIAAGSSSLDAPWIQGDEHIFIVRNPDVSGAGPSQPTGLRWLDIFLRPHEDLYQPVSILTYAIEWSLWGQRRVFHIRLTDVLIHVLNTLLLWAVLRSLFVRLYPQGRREATAVGWALAFVWSLHPMYVSVYAADMGRTHLLAATFMFISLLCHLRALRPGGWRWFVAAYFALLLAMLNKPMVGWVIAIFALEWALIGWHRTLRSPRIYLIGALCAGFAVLTLWTTREALDVEGSSLPLFGSPLPRAALGFWLYLGNFFAPGWRLSFWYPPDIHTGWDYWAVWLSVFFLLAAGAAALIAARYTPTRGVAVGLLWLVGMWLPVSGLVGARAVAGQDRYFYLPAVGLLLAIGILILHSARRRPEFARRAVAAVVAAACVLGVVALPCDRSFVRQARSTLKRAQRAVELNPGDPRVLELLAAAYDFCRNHDTPEARRLSASDFEERMVATALGASALAQRNPQYFGDARARAAFHRRLSFMLWSVGRYEASLAQARRAQEFEPDAQLTWLRLAHAYRALGRLEDTRRAYERLVEVMSPDSPDRGLRYLEYADLLLNRFDEPLEALHMYRKALETPQLLSRDAQRLAMLGAARCEVLAGTSGDGYQLALEVLRVEPNDLEAAKVVALYYVHNQQWDAADELYRRILEQFPTDYECLRRFQDVCRVKGNWSDAAMAWQVALDREASNPLFHPHFVWAAACAGEESAGLWADKLLAISPDSRFACLAQMLLAVRAEKLDQALQWLRRARNGAKLPQAEEFRRAEATLQAMIERGELPAAAVLIQAALWSELGSAQHGERLIGSYLEQHPDSRWGALAQKILDEDLAGAAGP